MDGVKTRIDAWGEELSEETRWEIYGLTKPPQEGDEERVYLRTYEDAKAYLAEGLRLSPPSRAGWYRFLARMRQQLQLKTIFRVSGSCESAKEMASEAKIDFTKAADAFRAQAVDAAMDGNEKAAALYANAATAFAQESRKAEELKIALRKLELLEKKEADAKKTVTDTKLTPEEREQKLKEIFGL